MRVVYKLLSMRLELVITSLVLLGGVSSVVVPPPENVVVVCEGLTVRAGWKYSNDQPQTTFKVDVQGDSGHTTIKTKEHQCDLSHFVWQSEENYMGFLYVRVSAVQGGNQSEVARSNSFSFNDLKTVDTKCMLEFPRVNVNSDDSGTSVKFPNPLYSNKKLKQTAEGGSPPELRFTVSLDDRAGDFYGVCAAGQDSCKLDVTFPEGVEKCVTLAGWLYDSTRVSHAVFRKTKRVCAPPPDHLYVVAIALGTIFAITIIVAVIAICWARAWTMRTEPLPSLLNHSQQNHIYPQTPCTRDEILVLCHECPKSISEDEVPFLGDCPVAELAPADGRVGGEAEELQAVAAVATEESTCEPGGTDGDSADGYQGTKDAYANFEDETQSSAYEDDQCSAYEDENQPSAYESRGIAMDMGGGDMVEGYRDS